ncbi:hypothetical protein MKZ21_15195 [Paenibacillus sp. FSL P2-0536]
MYGINAVEMCGSGWTREMYGINASDLAEIIQSSKMRSKKAL